MSTDGPELDDDLDTRLAELERAKNEAIERCHYRTAIRLATELKRTARTARRLEPYVWALHTMMNNAPSVLEPEAGQEAAVELIAVLESEERARQIQPDVDSGSYDWLVSRVSSCAYDGMGRSTALARGYNSEGVHETVAEGIQVCRRTGKLECVNCFREYAADVDRAADDLDMAIHHARQVVTHGNVNKNFDRRWSGAADEASLHLIAGRLDAAEAAVRQAWEFVPTSHNPISARLSTAITDETIRLLIDGTAGGTRDDIGADLGVVPPEDEWPEHHKELALVRALRATLDGDHATAIKTLTSWDQRLLRQKCLDLWFVVRLRLIAAYHLAGQADRASGLVRQLETKAREARDWLTLRRLKVLLDPELPTSPIAPAGPIVHDSATPTELESTPATEAEAEVADPDAEAATPLGESIQSLVIAMIQAGEDLAARAKVLEAVTALQPWLATNPVDVSQLLLLARVLADDPATGPAVWDWAEAIAGPFPRAADVLNALAALGESLRGAEESIIAERISPERIEQLFRSSLDLDPNNAGNFNRAAVHHASAGRGSEAERCLARVLRLDRTNSRAALWLAKIYSSSDRLADALAVLDMALRAGSADPDIAWEAVGIAHSLNQNEALLTYLDRFEAARTDAPWASYYRASGLLRLGRPTEAVAALDEETRRNPACPLPVLILRVCAAASLADHAALRTHLAAILDVPLNAVDYLTHSGLISLFERLWDVVVPALPARDRLIRLLGDRLLATGLAPNSFFQPDRKSHPQVENLTLYVCIIDQPLDARWAESPGCLNGEGDWTCYRTAWGLLAADEATAATMVLAWQARCAPLPATVRTVEVRNEGFTDHPGIIWQGIRGQGTDPE